MGINQRVNNLQKHGGKIGEKYGENIQRNTREKVMAKIMDNTIGEHNWRNWRKIY
jgi:hypothetical protein